MYPAFEKIKTRWEEVVPDDWFFPMTIKGVNQHEYISKALEHGATGFSYERGYSGAHTIRGQEVLSLREELFSLAKKKRALLKGKIAVIGGSAGKTTVKEIFACLMRTHKVKSFASTGNQNTKIALASQMLSLPNDSEYSAFEVGARRMGDFSIPIDFLRPDVVALLNIGRAHLGEFGSEQNLRATKLSLLECNANKLVVPHGSDIHNFAKTLNGKKIITFGRSTGADIILLKEELSAVQIQWRGELFEAPNLGPCFGTNLTAALALADALELPRALELSHFTNPRFQKTKWQGREVIDDAFNASPESMIEGLQYFAQIVGGRESVLVLGGILELGEKSEQIHHELGLFARKLFSGHILCVGEEAKSMALSAKAEHVNTAQEARSFLQESQSWEIAYIKGSKAIGLHKLLE